MRALQKTSQMLHIRGLVASSYDYSRTSRRRPARWTSVSSEQLQCHREAGNNRDRYAMALGYTLYMALRLAGTLHFGLLKTFSHSPISLRLSKKSCIFRSN